MADYNTMFLNQTAAGTGRRRGVGFTGTMLGRAQYAPALREKEIEERRGVMEDFLEAEALREEKANMEREYANQVEAQHTAEEQARQASMIRGADVALKTAMSPTGKELIGKGIGVVKDAYYTAGKGAGILPQTPSPLNTEGYVDQFVRTGMDMVVPETTAIATPTATSLWAPAAEVMATTEAAPSALSILGMEEAAAPLISEGMGTAVETGVETGMATGTTAVGTVASDTIGQVGTYAAPLVRMADTIGKGGDAWDIFKSAFNPGVQYFMEGDIPKAFDAIFDPLSLFNGTVEDMVRDVGAAIGDAVGDAVDFVGDVGDTIGDAAESVGDFVSDPCTLFSYLYGPTSHEVRYAKVYCYRHMNIPTLLGYYQTAKWIRQQSERHGLKSTVLWFGESFQRYIRWKLGRGRVRWYDRLIAGCLVAIFNIVHTLTTNQFVPTHTCLPLLRARGGV